jgi:hypothetical protein
MKKSKIEKHAEQKTWPQKKLDIIPTHPNKYTDSELF